MLALSEQFFGGGWLRRGNKWKWVAVWLAAAALVWWFVATRAHLPSFDWRLAAASFAGLRGGWLILSVIAIFATYYVRALRWAVFLKPLKPEVSAGTLFGATLIGFTAITLFGRPGEFVRPYLIARKEAVPVTSQFAAWVLERVFDLLMALLWFGFALTRVQAAGPKLELVLSYGGKIAWIAGSTALLLLISMRHFAESLRRWLLAGLGFLPKLVFTKIEKLVDACVQGVESTRSDAALLLMLTYTIIERVLITVCYWCVAQAFAGIIALGFADVLILMGFVSFGAIFQIPGIGGGMQVAAVLVLTELFRVKFEVATDFAMMIWIITFVAVVPAGLLLGVKEGLDWHSLRRIGEEVPE
jgi:hypothetical protein